MAAARVDVAAAAAAAAASSMEEAAAAKTEKESPPPPPAIRASAFRPVVLVRDSPKIANIKYY